MPHRLRRALSLALLAGSLSVAGCSSKPPEWKELDISLGEPVPEGMHFTWEHVAAADGYRLRFLHMTGAVVCSLDVPQAKHPEFLVRADSLLEGLHHGWQVTLEIQALRRGESWPVSGVRPFKVP